MVLFQLHERLLCDVSRRFEEIIGVLSREHVDGNLELSLDEDATVFEYFQTWLYSNRLEILATDDDEFYTLLLKIYVFGEKQEIPCLQNDALEALWKAVYEKEHIPTDHINWVYENTGNHSRLRNVFVHLLVNWGQGDGREDCFKPEMIGRYPKQFLFDVARDLSERAESFGPGIDLPLMRNIFLV